MGERRGRPSCQLLAAPLWRSCCSWTPARLRRASSPEMSTRLSLQTASTPPLPLRERESESENLGEPCCGWGRRKLKTFVICVCESRRCHLYVCCHVATVKSSGRILQIIMSGVTQPNWFSPSSSAFFQSSAVTQVAKSGELGEGCHDVSVKFLTAAYNR